ncbi:TRAFAC clade GTPase domain-containing protein [Achromobacter xylosoxidans]
MAETELVCANRECRIAKGGRCIEGHDDLAKCLYYGKEPEGGDQDEGDDDQEAIAPFDGVFLPDALPLESRGADRVLASLPSRMIGVIGVHDSGKTSVIAGLFDLFQVGPVAHAIFAGSSTLHGLEIICHDARVASERDEPHSERTKRGEVRFYHFDVLRDGLLQSLLIADRSGEEYEEVADLTANATAMFELRRADVITVLVDGRRLASSRDRADVMGAIPLIIQGMVENGAFSRKPNLAIVLTKDDAVQASPRKDQVQRDFIAIIDGIRDAFASHFGEFGSFVTSASPKEANVVRGAGLAEMLAFWMKPSAEPQGIRLRHNSGRVLDGLMIEEAKRG